MKLFNIYFGRALKGRSAYYVTKDAVERANARLMEQGGVVVVGGDDVYARYQLQRPTRDDIEKAAAKAMKHVAVHN